MVGKWEGSDYAHGRVSGPTDAAGGRPQGNTHDHWWKHMLKLDWGSPGSTDEAEFPLPELKEPILGSLPLLHPSSTSNCSVGPQFKPYLQSVHCTGPAWLPSSCSRHSSFDLRLKLLTQAFIPKRGIISFLGMPGCATNGLRRLGRILNPPEFRLFPFLQSPWSCHCSPRDSM